MENLFDYIHDRELTQRKRTARKQEDRKNDYLHSALNKYVYQ